MDCCDQHSSVADELAEMALDPTLQECCRKDLQEQAYVARLKGRLLSVDRVDHKVNLARRIVQQTLPLEEAQVGDKDHSDIEADDAGI
jgi:hypothetical protein